jgi:hypothetical protein
MDKLLHWVLLNTEVRDQVEAELNTRITHSTKTAGLPDEDKVSRQLCTMNIMERLGYPPQLSVWRAPGTLMEGTYKLEVNDTDEQVKVAGRQQSLTFVCSDLQRGHGADSIRQLHTICQTEAQYCLWSSAVTGLLVKCLPHMQVLGTVYVNDHVSSANIILVEIALRGLQGVSIKWDEAGQRWRVDSGEDDQASDDEVKGGPAWEHLIAWSYFWAVTAGAEAASCRLLALFEWQVQMPGSWRW